MAKADAKPKEHEDITAIPEPRDAADSQVVPVGNMDTDPRTGALLKVGIPETSDEDDVAEFILWLQEQAEEGNTDEMAMLAQMLRQANTAETVADALRDKTTVNGKDHCDVPFMCTGFTIREGKFEDETLPYYASLDVLSPEYPGGYVVNCGGYRILVHLRSLQRFNAFPIPLAIRGKTTRKGRTTLTFEVLQQAK